MTDQRSKVNSDGTENPIFLPTGAFAPARRKRRRVRVKCTVNFRAPCSVISVRPAPRDLAPRPCKILRPAPVTFASAADIFPPTAPARTFTRHRCPHNRLRLLTHCSRAPYPACFCDRFRASFAHRLGHTDCRPRHAGDALPCRSARFCPHRESAASLPAASAGTFTSRRRTDVFIVLRPFLCIFSCTAAALYAASQKNS